MTVNPVRYTPPSEAISIPASFLQFGLGSFLSMKQLIERIALVMWYELISYKFSIKLIGLVSCFSSQVKSGIHNGYLCGMSGSSI